MMVRIAVALLLFTVLLSSAALAQKRIALVIGNSTYKHAGVLANPENDAADMATALKKHGFVVIDGFKVSFWKNQDLPVATIPLELVPVTVRPASSILDRRGCSCSSAEG